MIGRSRPVLVHELSGFAGEPEPPEHAVFAECLSHLHRGDWQKARECFAALEEDKAALRYLDEGFEGWDGVITLQSK